MKGRSRRILLVGLENKVGLFAEGWKVEWDKRRVETRKNGGY